MTNSIANLQLAIAQLPSCPVAQVAHISHLPIDHCQLTIALVIGHWSLVIAHWQLFVLSREQALAMAKPA